VNVKNCSALGSASYNHLLLEYSCLDSLIPACTKIKQGIR
jgi:hypothetical protein